MRYGFYVRVAKTISHEWENSERMRYRFWHESIFWHKSRSFRQRLKCTWHEFFFLNFGTVFSYLISIQSYYSVCNLGYDVISCSKVCKKNWKWNISKRIRANEMKFCTVVVCSYTYILICLCGCQGNVLVPSLRASSHTVSAVYWLRKAPVSQSVVDKY